jgi:hypothetical protein
MKEGSKLLGRQEYAKRVAMDLYRFMEVRREHGVGLEQESNPTPACPTLCSVSRARTHRCARLQQFTVQRHFAPDWSLATGRRPAGQGGQRAR